MFSIDPLYAYVLLTVPFAVIWATLFFFGNTESKKEQVVVSLIGLVMGPVTEILHFTDYWMPQSIFSFKIGTHPVLLEDLLFGFFFAGTVAVLYTSLFRKTLNDDYNFRHLVPLTLFSLLATALVVALWMGGVNSIYASTAGFLLVAVLIFTIRPDLYTCALWSGLLTSGVLYSIYFTGFNLVSNSDNILRSFWFLFGTDLGFRVSGVPLSELLWGFGAGIMVSIIYKVITGKRIHPQGY